MTEKKKGVRRIHPLDREYKEMDQPLRSAGEAPSVGRIHPEQTAVPPVVTTPTDPMTAASPNTAANPKPAAEAKPTANSGPTSNQKSGAAARQGTGVKPAANPKPAASVSGKKAEPQKRGPKSRKPESVKKAAGPKRPTSTPRPAAEKSEKKPVKKAADALKKRVNPNAGVRPASQKRGSRRRPSKKPAIRAYFLGGLNEIGKNFTLFECEEDMIIVDCGMAFPNETMLGIDCVIPDFTFAEKNIRRIRGIVITHGHEDHIGGLPYLLKRLNVPVYGTALTIGLIGSKLKEHNLLRTAKLNVCHAGDRLKLGCMEAELIHVNHSVSDAVAIAIHSPAGTLVHTGDFKIDFTPAEGRMIDLARFAALGHEGVLGLFMDSTNAERPGYTQTEQLVNNSLEGLFHKAEGKRIIVATFASNISRVQMIINCAQKTGRKVALSGRSMLNVMGIASELGYLKVPDGILIDLNMINRYQKGEIVLVTTGSQGEPMSALTRMAFSDHRQVDVDDGDFIILSAKPIPGNEKTVGSVVNELLRKNCTVIYESIYDVHVSGHACQEELKLIQSLVAPKYFIPVHGEHKHLRKNAGLAMALGMSPANIFIGDNGSVLELHEDYMKQLADCPADEVLVDGLGVGDVGSVVLRDRRHLGEDGIIIAVCSIDAKTGHVISDPDIVSRGFVYVRESEKLMDEARVLVYNTLEDCAKHGLKDWNGLKQNVKDELSRFLYRRTRRNPMILPIIMEI